uniref:Fucosyltransferase n=1 Tax=Ciona intestinalis TaxID=7719 RepID=H2XV74_CIOIN
LVLHMRLELSYIVLFLGNSINHSFTSLFSLPKEFVFDEEDMKDEHGNPYHIILWNDLSGVPGYVANPTECMGNISCQISYNKGAAADAHAIVFPIGVSRSMAPSVSLYFRKPWQLYAWWTLESPLHAGGDLRSFDEFFNLTFNYRLDAGVYAPYGSINLILRELRKSGETELEPLLERKRNSDKMAAWAVSNCYGKRMDFAKSLMDAGLQVDTFGGCFGGRQIGGGRYSDTFYSELQKYRFYFSFENSINCKDYFTEKFWFNGLRSGAVPVVWGPRKSDILKVAPTKSFIHSNDFDTPGELVKYLKYLATNETAYAEYLHWRTWVNHPEKIETRLRLENRENDLRSFCKLCSMVQSDGRDRKRIVHSLNEAWIGTEKGEC